MNPERAIRELEFLQSRIPGLSDTEAEIGTKVLSEIGDRSPGAFSRLRQVFGFSSSRGADTAIHAAPVDPVETELARMKEEMHAGTWVDPVEAQLLQMKRDMGLVPQPTYHVTVTEIRPTAPVRYPQPGSLLALESGTPRLALPAPKID